MATDATSLEAERSSRRDTEREPFVRSDLTEKLKLLCFECRLLSEQCKCDRSGWEAL